MTNTKLFENSGFYLKHIESLKLKPIFNYYNCHHFLFFSFSACSFIISAQDLA